MQELPNTALQGAQAVSENLSHQLDRARARLDDDVTLARWILEVRDRLERRKLIFLHADPGVDIDDLVAEVEAFKAACQGVRA